MATTLAQEWNIVYWSQRLDSELRRKYTSHDTIALKLHEIHGRTKSLVIKEAAHDALAHFVGIKCSIGVLVKLLLKLQDSHVRRKIKHTLDALGYVQPF